MAEKLTEKINRIIKQSDIEDAKLKKLYVDVFTAMSEYQEDLQDKVYGNVKQELQCGSADEALNLEQLWVIKTLLCREDEEADWNARGLEKIKIADSINGSVDPLAQEMEDEGRQIFLDVPYEELEDYCRRQYRGYYRTTAGERVEFSYTLQVHDRFKREEDKLYHLAELYGINKPVIYSPYARRGVDIFPQVADMQGFKEAYIRGDVDFALADNAMEGKLLLDHILMWNVIRSDNSIFLKSEKGLVPHALAYQYTSLKDDIETNDFIFVDGYCEKIYKNANGIGIFSKEKLSEERYYKVTISPVEGETKLMFTNFFDADRVSTQESLRSRADVEYVLSRFKTNVYTCSLAEINQKSGQAAILRYRREHAYYEPKNEFFYNQGRCKPQLLVKFSGADEFKVDFVNYVLHFLEHAYPDFTWVGVE